MAITAAVLAAAGPAIAETVPPGWYADYLNGNVIAPSTNLDRIGVAIGFAFPFYGNDYTNASVQYSGYVGLGDSLVNNVNFTATPDNWPYYTWAEQSSRIAAALAYPYNYNWPRDKARIYYETVGEEGQHRFVVTYDVYLDADETKNVLFQVQLHEETGRIQFSYYRIHEELTGARIGINYGNGVEHTGFWYDGDENYDGDGAYNANMQGPQGSLDGLTLYFDYDPSIGSYVATPEPATLSLLAFGGLALLPRRNFKAGRPVARMT
jgi:hypothetical protein